MQFYYLAVRRMSMEMTQPLLLVTKSGTSLFLDTEWFNRTLRNVGGPMGQR